MTFDERFLRAEKAAEKSRPKAKDPHTSGLVAVAVALFAIIAFYVLYEIFANGFVAGGVSLVCAYVAGWFFSNEEWSRHAAEFAREFEKESDDKNT